MTVEKKLRAKLIEIVSSNRDLTDSEFETLALEAFAFQFERCEPFRRLCEARWVKSPGEVSDYRRIPCMPTEAFKHYRVACFPKTEGEIEFHTSGTTSGRPGVHVMPDTELYDAAAMAWFERCVLNAQPRAAVPHRESKKSQFIALTGSPSEMPHSSLVHMIETAGRRFSSTGKADYFFSDGRVDVEGLSVAVEAARGAGEAVVLMTTAFGMVMALDELRGANPDDQGQQSRPSGKRIEMPEGSIIMETGGYKGRTRELSREELYSLTSETFGIPQTSIINEYGMTEMSSQYYDAPATNSGEPRIKIGPPWLRAEIVNPITLEPVGEGEIGLLQHIDLANLHSCAFLMTADAARKMKKGFELLGRFSDVEPRGCSLNYER